MLEKFALISMLGIVAVLVLSASAPGPVVPARQYQYGPASLATGIVVDSPHYYQYGPASFATGIVVDSPHYYEYGPASLATGFLGAPHYYQYGPASLATGFAAPK